MTSQSSSTILLLLSLFTIHTNSMVAEDWSKHCNLELLHSYGMHGMGTPKQIVLEMCPNVRTSCCKKSDQLEMFAAWVHNFEEKMIKKHYRELTDDYANLFEELIDTHVHARDIIKKLSVKRVANCKLIAQRILNFEVEEVLAQIKVNLRKMEDFFVDTYRGFYCSICNHDNHKFIQMDKGVVNFSEKFCRDIVQNTLPVAIFWHEDVVRYLNLVSKFLLSCDYKGDYQANVFIPKEHIFAEDEVIAKHLSNCRDYRNKKTWFAYCEDLCHEFHVARYSPFFEPHREQIVEYTAFLKKTLAKIKSEEGRDPSFVKKVGEPDRMLLDKDADNEDKKREIQHEEGVIFGSGLQAKVKLETYKSSFGADGISMFDDGKNSLINENMYNQIKNLLNLERTSISTGSVGMSKLDKKLARALKGSSIFKIITVMIVGKLMMA